MSGIFGFTYRAADQAMVEDAIGGLSYWNRIYGRAASDRRTIGTSGLGCHVEHFSDRFSYGGPILTVQGKPAVVDALLYNREELLAELSPDADPDLSDEELLLSLVDRKGFSALARVNGDFAGAVFDEERREWTLFRDHMGVRTLYYYLDDDKIVFSTDLRGVLSAPGVDGRVNEDHIYKFLVGLNYLTATQTEFRNIHCLQPGAVVRFRMTDRNCVTHQKLFWRVRQRRIRLGSDEAYIRRMRELVTDAVNRRCDAIPGLLGAELSGGLDSSTIDILINRHGREGVYFCWGVSPEVRPLAEGEDERQVILDICAQENITCRFREYGEDLYFAQELKEHMPPFLMSTRMVSGCNWMRSQGARVVFSGHGGDEGVSHRASPFELLCNLELWSYFKIHWMYLKGKKLRFLRAIKSGYLEAKTKFPENFVRYAPDKTLASVLHPAFFERMRRTCKVPLTAFRFAPHRYVREGGSRTRLDDCVFLGAYTGIRYLFPYVDYRVMDFALSIPRRLHVNHETSRWIFRRAFHDIMPQSLRDVQYKDVPSARGKENFRAYNRSFHNNIGRLLELLDREVWGDILNFEGFDQLGRKEILSKDDIAVYNMFINRARQCLLIQDIQKNAPRWRELEDEDE